MDNLGQRIDFHTHSLLSDGVLLPAEAMRYACVMGYMAMAITDHADYSVMDNVIKQLLLFQKKQARFLDVRFIPGVEITHADPSILPQMAKDARSLGAKIIVCHGETPSEPVTPGTNHAAVSKKGLIDILAHPGYITEEDAALARDNGVYLELSAKSAHNETNKHVAKTALKVNAKMLVNTDAHIPENYISQQKAYEIAKGCGLSDEDALKTVRDNTFELLARIK